MFFFVFFFLGFLEKLLMNFRNRFCNGNRERESGNRIEASGSIPNVICSIHICSITLPSLRFTWLMEATRKTAFSQLLGVCFRLISQFKLLDSTYWTKMDMMLEDWFPSKFFKYWNNTWFSHVFTITCDILNLFQKIFLTTFRPQNTNSVVDPKRYYRVHLDIKNLPQHTVIIYTLLESGSSVNSFYQPYFSTDMQNQNTPAAPFRDFVYDPNDPWQNYEYFHQYGKLVRSKP